MGELKNAKSQSAMEYLMTYGWAILAIAIVMVSLYSLGIFNLGNLAPTATPGSCQVIRTAAQTSLAGQCNNLIPKYVGQFNGGYITTGATGFPKGNADISMFAWINERQATSYPNVAYITGSGTSAQINTNNATSSTLNPRMCTAGYCWIDSRIFTTNQWAMLGFTYSASTGNVIIYLNGVGGSPLTGGGQNFQTTSFSIGAGPRFFNGSIANVQVYNISLDNATVKALYREGIGGAPIDLQHIVGWWPLNGNANDYSGNNNQGTVTNPVVWNANWQSGYTSPAS
ncbi:MAG: hypothetical protein KGI00_01015 [Candidatus Micrarchaeota archaeon]|nr:hypothetical protein [Candidatus Micrarchaeota archaeon]